MAAALTAQGIDAARLAAHGRGDRQPVADNGTGAGRAQPAARTGQVLKNLPIAA